MVRCPDRFSRLRFLNNLASLFKVYGLAERLSYVLVLRIELTCPAIADQFQRKWVQQSRYIFVWFFAEEQSPFGIAAAPQIPFRVRVLLEKRIKSLLEGSPKGFMLRVLP
jgi:hypothetical protein